MPSGLTQVAVLVVLHLAVLVVPQVAVLMVPKAVGQATDVSVRKEVTAAAAKVKRRVKDWGLTTLSKAKAVIWQKGWF